MTMDSDWTYTTYGELGGRLFLLPTSTNISCMCLGLWISKSSVKILQIAGHFRATWSFSSTDFSLQRLFQSMHAFPRLTLKCLSIFRHLLERFLDLKRLFSQSVTVFCRPWVENLSIKTSKGTHKFGWNDCDGFEILTFSVSKNPHRCFKPPTAIHRNRAKLRSV